MGLSKQQIQEHDEAMALVHSDKTLTWEERLFVLDNYQESANNVNSKLGAFFTPSGLARDFTLEVGSGKIIDLCAGIGSLSFWMYFHNYACKPNITCVEYNSDYLSIGKRVLPEADWILGDALTVELDTDYDYAYSNPPFGNIKTSDSSNLRYTGSEFEYKIIERASQIAKFGAFIIPQYSSGFKYSGTQMFEIYHSPKYKKFMKDTGMELHPGCGIDTSFYLKEWHGVSPLCEVAVIDFTEYQK